MITITAELSIYTSFCLHFQTAFFQFKLVKLSIKNDQKIMKIGLNALNNC